MENQLTKTFDIQKIVTTTAALIKFDNTPLIEEAKNIVTKYATLVISEDDLPEMKSICTELRKNIKMLDDSRKDIKRDYNIPLNKFESEIKEVTDIFTSAINGIESKTAVFIEKQKADKKEMVLADIATMLADYDLPLEYSNRVTWKDEYYQKQFTTKKLKDDIQSQINVAVALKKGDDDAKELERMKLQNRELLIDNLNKLYGFDAKPSQLPHSQYSDEQVEAFYAKKQQLIKDKEAADAKKLQEEQKIKLPSVEVAPAQKQEPINKAVDTSLPINHIEPNEAIGLSITKTYTFTVDVTDSNLTLQQVFNSLDTRLSEMKGNLLERYKVKLDVNHD